jgi:hypothetical protein
MVDAATARLDAQGLEDTTVITDRVGFMEPVPSGRVGIADALRWSWVLDLPEVEHA